MTLDADELLLMANGERHVIVQCELPSLRERGGEGLEFTLQSQIQILGGTRHDRANLQAHSSFQNDVRSQGRDANEEPLNRKHIAMLVNEPGALPQPLFEGLVEGRGASIAAHGSMPLRRASSLASRSRPASIDDSSQSLSVRVIDVTKTGPNRDAVSVRDLRIERAYAVWQRQPPARPTHWKGHLDVFWQHVGQTVQ